MKKALKLQDHKHTAKHLEHKHTSYRGLFVLLFIFGICLFVIQNTVSAADYLVTAKISAPIPGTAAQITSPAGGFITNNPLVEVQGTCPIVSPAILVELSNNGQIIGSTICKSDGTFGINITLNNGANNVFPRIINITQDYGQSGNIVTINYNPPQTEQIGLNQNANSINQVLPNSRQQNSVPYLVVENPFIVYSLAKEFTWTLDIAGGTSPYTITIDWGDGKTESYNKNEPGKLTISHRYSRASTYVVKVAITDIRGAKTIQSFSAITLVSYNRQSVMGAIGNTKLEYMFNYKNLYAIYIFLILLVLSFWYGARLEQQKYAVAFSSRKSKKRR